MVEAVLGLVGALIGLVGFVLYRTGRIESKLNDLCRRLKRLEEDPGSEDETLG